MKYKFTILEKLPSLNDYTKACRSNVYYANNMKHKTQNIIFKYARELPKITKPVKIKFTWVESNSRRDLDNICFAKKFILDALVKANVLKNDTHSYVTGFTDTFQYDKKSKVIIEIEEIN